MKVECTDLMDPRLVCVGTISRVVGRLLKVGSYPVLYIQYIRIRIGPVFRSFVDPDLRYKFTVQRLTQLTENFLM